MVENTKSTFICFNEEMKVTDGGTVCMIVRFENVNLPNEKIAGAREILGDAAQKLRNLLGL